MTDTAIKSIDHVFDVVDRALDRLGHVFTRAELTEKTAEKTARRMKRTPDVIDVESVTTDTVTTPTKKAPKKFRIVETIAANTKVMTFVVTNGSERAECATRPLAEKILRALETK